MANKSKKQESKKNVKENKIEATKKNSNNKDDSIKKDSLDTWFKVITTIFIVFLIISIFYFLTVFIVGDKVSKPKDDVSFNYEEILAGSSFTREENEYYVIFYKFDEEESYDIESAIMNFSHSENPVRVYKVNLNDGFNKKYIDEKESNNNPSDVSQLKVKGTTLMHFKSGKVYKYIEGASKIVDYLK